MSINPTFRPQDVPAIKHWNPKQFGCIERDTFRLKPMMRTALTSQGSSPTRSKTADVRAPITASFQVNQTRAQWSAFTQWLRVDLSGGARPFTINLWMWDHMRTVRARLLEGWSAQQSTFDAYVLAGTFEIERESIHDASLVG